MVLWVMTVRGCQNMQYKGNVETQGAPPPRCAGTHHDKFLPDKPACFQPLHQAT